jgi:hypothetical protein
MNGIDPEVATILSSRSSALTTSVCGHAETPARGREKSPF